MGLLPAVRRTRHWLHLARNPAERRRAAIKRREFELFRRQYMQLFRHHLYRPGAVHGKVLVVSLGMVDVVRVELALIKAFEAAGYVPCVVMDYDPDLVQYYKAAGISNIQFWDDYGYPDASRWAHSALDKVHTSADLLALQLNQIRVGKYAASTVLRYFRLGELNIKSPEIRRYLEVYLSAAARSAIAAEAIVAALQPQLALSIDIGYSPRGEMFDACHAAGVDTITWNSAHKNNTLMLKRYRLANRNIHHSSLSDETWAALCAAEWTEAHRQCLHTELFGAYNSGEWYSEVGTQFAAQFVDQSEIQHRLGLDPGKKTAVVFAHIFWDATFFWGTDLFDSYQDWFVETLRAAGANANVNWILKVHPGNTVKNQRDGVHAEPSEIAAIRDHIGNLPPHVVLLDADTDISTYSLLKVVDYCLTVRGTVGIEAASFGISVLTAGTGRFDRRGFTFDSDTKEEYLVKVANIHDVPPLAKNQRELAERFAYGTFVARPLPLESVSLEYVRDDRASVQTRVHLDTPEEWNDASDVQSVAVWIRANTEDFLTPGHISDSHADRAHTQAKVN